MSKIRNPRYAPDFVLERKLSPSSLGVIPVTAEVAVTPLASYQDSNPTYPPLDPYPPVGNGCPPLIPPSLPGGPSDPA